MYLSDRRSYKRLPVYWCLCSLALLFLPGLSPKGIAYGQSDPPTLDEQLVRWLGLGERRGCYELLRVPPGITTGEGANNVIAELQRLRGLNQIGAELARICGPEQNVNSGSALGGSLDTLQATKTVSQVRIARRRVDRRLGTGPQGTQGTQPRKFRSFFLDPQADAQRQPDISLQTPGAENPGFGLFGEISREWKKKDITDYDLGYDGHVGTGLVGVDYAWNRAVAGVWGSYSAMNTDYQMRPVDLNRNYNLTGFTPTQRQAVEDLLALCEGRNGGGELENHAVGFGGFAGWSLGGGGLLDIGFSHYRTNHNYTRSFCSFEQGGSLFDQRFDLDQYFAGWVSGSTEVKEFGASVRGGYDIEKDGWVFSPRGIFQFIRTSVDGYQETGQAITKLTNSQSILYGGPIGAELVYEGRRRNSPILDVGGEIAYRFDFQGSALIPRVSAYWRHQFDDGFIFHDVRLAQDLRPNPVKFSVASDRPDPNTAILSAGVTSLIGQRFAAQVEVSQLAGHEFMGSTLLSAQFRVRF
jgi:uncharacterized protein YhjY with autotransporter beta-barrel domain